MSQRVAIERKKVEAEFAVKLERSGVAQLSAEADKLKKTIALLNRTGSPYADTDRRSQTATHFVCVYVGAPHSHAALQRS